MTRKFRCRLEIGRVQFVGFGSTTVEAAQDAAAQATAGYPGVTVTAEPSGGGLDTTEIIVIDNKETPTHV